MIFSIHWSIPCTPSTMSYSSKIMNPIIRPRLQKNTFMIILKNSDDYWSHYVQRKRSMNLPLKLSEIWWQLSRWHGSMYACSSSAYSQINDMSGCCNQSGSTVSQIHRTYVKEFHMNHQEQRVLWLYVIIIGRMKTFSAPDCMQLWFC